MSAAYQPDVISISLLPTGAEPTVHLTNGGTISAKCKSSQTGGIHDGYEAKQPIWDRPQTIHGDSSRGTWRIVQPAGCRCSRRQPPFSVCSHGNRQSSGNGCPVWYGRSCYRCVSSNRS